MTGKFERPALDTRICSPVPVSLATASVVALLLAMPLSVAVG